MFRRCCCDTLVYPACLGLTGSWSASSGSWSTTSDANFDYYVCSSAGAYIYTPSSGLSVGDYMGLDFYIGGTDEFVGGFLFDAEDEDNCHRIKVTRTSTTFTMALQRVVSGVVTTVDEWDTTYTRNVGGFTFLRMIVAEYEKFTAITIADGSGDLLFQFGSMFPRDATYSKLGNGNKFGVWCDSFSYTSMWFASEAGTLEAGRNKCVSAGIGVCGSTLVNSAWPYFGLSEEVNVVFDLSSVSSVDDCPAYDFTTFNADWDASALPAGYVSGDECGFMHGTPTPTCTPPSGNGDWVIEYRVFLTSGVEFQNVGGDKVYTARILYNISRNTGSFTGGIEVECAGLIKRDQLEVGESFTLPVIAQSETGTVPFTATWNNATVTML